MYPGDIVCRAREALNVASAMAQLTSEDRLFFAEAARLVMSNPFGAEREAADRALSAAPTELGRDEVVERLLEVIALRLKRLGGPLLDVRAYSEDEREMLQLALLFGLFHEIAPELDEDIDDEVAGRPLSPLAAVDDVLRRLEVHGFTPEEADRYVAIVWQARRAYHFIQRMLVGDGPSMRRLRESLWNNVFTHDLLRYAQHLHRKMEDFSTFVVGETGAGKTAAAAAIGRSGFIPYDRKAGDFRASFTECFLATNLSAVPPTLIESELFGHEKGAFTGAVERHPGLFSRCSPHGAVFLDEIGEVSSVIQIKLLRVLQERRFTAVGSHQEQRFEGRVIVATNRSIEAMARAGDFRPDLYYRLSSDVIEVPPLRQRFAEAPAELEQMVEVILRRLLGRDEPSLTCRILEVIERDLPAGYPWPGNVRELEQCTRRILLRGDAKASGWPQLPGRVEELRGAPTSRSSLLELTHRGTWKLDRLIAEYCRLVYGELGSYEATGRRIGLDWRTVKRHVQSPPPSEELPRAPGAAKGPS